MTPAPLRRVSVVETLAAALRTQILEGALAAGTPLREHELAEGYDVSRHTLRAALRQLAGEGLVTVEANRGARVARLGRAQLVGLFELRTALELEAAHLALARHDGRLPAPVRQAVERLAVACARPRPSWRAIADLHAGVHSALVAAAGSPRIEAAYGALAGELQLFLVQLRPVWPVDRMASHHVALLADLERDGPEPLRRHLDEGRAAVLAAYDGEPG